MTSGGTAPSSSAASSVPFGLYAEVYDLLYQDKDYCGESEFVASLIRRFGAGGGADARVVDLACGTGRHVIQLAKMGFRTAGSDISQGMVNVARAAIDAEHLAIPLFVEPLQSCARIKGEFDVALAMFSSLGYLCSRDDLAAALSGVRSLLVAGGLFIFDVWNGLATLKDYSPVRVKRASNGSTAVLRVSRTALDEVEQIATVNFEFLVMPQGRAPIEFTEQHLVRFFLPRELSDILESNGFQVMLQCPFMDAGRVLQPADWNMTFVARKR